MVLDFKWSWSLAKIEDENRKNKKFYSQKRQNLIKKDWKVGKIFTKYHIECIFIQKCLNFYETTIFTTGVCRTQNWSGRRAPDIWAAQRPWRHRSSHVCTLYITVIYDMDTSSKSTMLPRTQAHLSKNHTCQWNEKLEMEKELSEKVKNDPLLNKSSLKLEKRL